VRGCEGIAITVSLLCLILLVPSKTFPWLVGHVFIPTEIKGVVRQRLSFACIYLKWWISWYLEKLYLISSNVVSILFSPTCPNRSNITTHHNTHKSSMSLRDRDTSAWETIKYSGGYLSWRLLSPVHRSDHNKIIEPFPRRIWQWAGNNASFCISFATSLLSRWWSISKRDMEYISPRWFVNRHFKIFMKLAWINAETY
jgi:hypothetical protein